MTYTLGIPVKDQEGRDDWYRVYLTRNPNYVDRNSTWEKNLAMLEGAWCEAMADYDPSFLSRLTDYINWTDLSDYEKLPIALEVELETESDEYRNGMRMFMRRDSAGDSSMWDDHIRRHLPFLDDARNGRFREMYAMLNRMYQSTVMHGITQGDIETQYLKTYPEIQDLRLMRTWDILLGVCEYVGIVPPQNHEQGASYLSIPVNTLLHELKYLPNFRPPTWQGGQWCLKTDQGLFNDRDLIALYIAMKIREKFPDTRTRIVDIGGGSGFISYWLYLFGYRNLTMVDLPTVMCCQAFQMHANHPEAVIALPNESHPAEVRFLDSRQFQEGNDRYDLVVNCDSFPEMSLETLHAYLDAIARQTSFFYSVNQESRSMGMHGRQHSVRYEIKNKFRERLMRVDRSRFWLRDGYTEEWYGVP